ncbi:hypothetical protein MNAN1_000738 [Malassezia nana]|uniref:Major facilitator superfamily (MFS) profile domain-containing protein n=1 Tax=Malassezia nana TaxID=180528 RepID=A0AAF0EPD7_9BASI|nr:hypothetical protein MNAN1_000738 [Malassezia nana]
MLHRVYGAPIGTMTYVVAILASMGGFLFGWDTGQIADLLVMQDFMERFAQNRQSDGSVEWNSWIQGLIVSLLSAGGIFGAVLGAPLTDKIGRRGAISVGCVIFTIGLIIQIASQYSWVQLMIGRLVVGISIGWLSSAVPVYQSETVPRQVRGAMVGTYQLLITLGILLSYCACYGTRHYSGSSQWRIPIGIGFAWGLILGIGILFCPESPRWLAKQGRYDEARKVLAMMRGVDESENYVMTEFYEIKQEIIEENNMKKLGWLDCFRFKQKALYRTLMGILLQMGQQLTGANYFFYYGATIFKPVNIFPDPEENSYVAQIILGAVNVFTTFPGLYALDRFGRRTCLGIGALWMTIWLIVFATAGVVGGETVNGEYGITSSSTATLMICSACFFILGFASTWGPGVWSSIAENAVPELRAKQMALATASNWTWNFLLAFFTSPITEDINFYYGYVFVGCCLASFLLVFFFLYETANLDLESIQAMYEEETLKPWSSAKWTPPGYESRTSTKQDVEHNIATIETKENTDNGIPSGTEP